MDVQHEIKPATEIPFQSFLTLIQPIVLESLYKISTVESRLSDLNGSEGQSDNRKCRIIRKTNEKDEGKYQLNL
jgi:hypothetical protein